MQYPLVPLPKRQTDLHTHGHPQTHIHTHAHTHIQVSYPRTFQPNHRRTPRILQTYMSYNYILLYIPNLGYSTIETIYTASAYYDSPTPCNRILMQSRVKSYCSVPQSCINIAVLLHETYTAVSSKKQQWQRKFMLLFLR